MLGKETVQIEHASRARLTGSGDVDAHADRIRAADPPGSRDRAYFTQVAVSHHRTRPASASASTQGRSEK